MWLLKCLKPDHNTISNFRRDNPQAIKKVFRTTVQIARHLILSEESLLQVIAPNSGLRTARRITNNQAKIDRHVAYIDNKLKEYTRALAENDGDNRQQIEDEIKKQQKRKEQLQKSGEAAQRIGRTTDLHF